MKKYKSELLLALAAFIWGIAFVAQSVSMDHIGPWTFTCVRSFIAAATLYVLLPVLDKITGTRHGKFDKKVVVGGIACGLALATASMFQQTGIQYTTVGKAGFLTALYTVIVPIFSLFLGKKSKWNVYVAVVISIIGMYFLCVNEDFSIAYGDTLILVCAVVFAIHILVIDHFGEDNDGIRMSCVQFLVVGIVCMIGMFMFEKPNVSDIIQAAIPILYAGILSSGAGYTLQIVGQKGADASIAGMILSLESVFAALAGAVLLNEMLSLKELVGCILVFGAIILSQIEFEKK